jgi:NADH-quinone oxidoreductase subunit J
MYELIAFYTFTILTIAMFSITVFTKNSLYAMSSLAGGMIFISGFFFLLDASFLGVVQLVVYSGAIMAIYAFGMMFFDTGKDVKENINTKKIIYTLGLGTAIMLVIIILAPIYSNNLEALVPIKEGVANANMVGYVLFTKYLIPFEVAAVMLLVAMIAGIVLVSKKMEYSLSENDPKEVEA